MFYNILNKIQSSFPISKMFSASELFIPFKRRFKVLSLTTKWPFSWDIIMCWNNVLLSVFSCVQHLPPIPSGKVISHSTFRKTNKSRKQIFNFRNRRFESFLWKDVEGDDLDVALINAYFHGSSSHAIQFHVWNGNKNISVNFLLFFPRRTSSAEFYPKKKTLQSVTIEWR